MPQQTLTLDTALKLEPTDVMSKVTRLQRAYLPTRTAEEKKNLGQFFTSSIVSDYMASMLDQPESNSIRILDAGAGSGILTASTALHCLRLGVTHVHAVLYELDPQVIDSLKKTLELVKTFFAQEKRDFTYEIRQQDFVLSRPDQQTGSELFDISVINPPYFKYSSKESPYARAASDLYRGDPNIYASFLGIALSSLKQGGQLVSITPRSFTNGLYFKGLRQYLLSESSINLIHIFKRRDKVFKSDDSSVLQENIICHFVKGANFDNVTIRSSNCSANISNSEEATYPTSLIIDPSNNESLIRVPESSEEAEILMNAELLATTFEGAGYFISTGRAVEHRTREFITTETNQANSVPLYRPHNVTPLVVTWSGRHKKDVSFLLNQDFEKHTNPNNTYVLLKRFSSKDEKRRLVAGVHIEQDHDCDFIAFGNKTNYIGIDSGQLEIDEALGLAAIFNSSFMDRYFRSISGNTQINATEVRVMRFPHREQVKEIGRLINEQQPTATNTAQIDLIVDPILGVMNH